jgi:hypothetical protein
MVWRPWRAYNLSMARTESQPQGAEDPDIIDSIPMLGRATTQLERSFGPSCLLSLIITLLILVVIGRYVQVSWIGRGVIVFIVWLGILVLLVRWRSDVVYDEDE